MLVRVWAASQAGDRGGDQIGQWPAAGEAEPVMWLTESGSDAIFVIDQRSVTKIGDHAGCVIP
ncbi:hypothetical protein [Actinoallomurus sp. NPDC050550]|uniref:hypothetical protein n=1 Tax=Actinoallomurus sp. NPDC050550 TaxID=3154937 RepID=UPI003405269C